MGAVPNMSLGIVPNGHTFTISRGSIVDRKLSKEHIDECSLKNFHLFGRLGNCANPPERLGIRYVLYLMVPTG